jgi:CelD/BcsL family acetyltransferase involved in cellulose biosynthesis
MQAERLDPQTDPRWLAAIASAPDSCVFHHPSWLHLLERSYGYEIQALGVVDGGTLVAGLPLARVASPLTGTRLVALPFSDVCPPFYTSEAGPGAARSLAAALALEHDRAAVRVEVRADFPGLPSGRRETSFRRHVLALAGDVSLVERRFSKSQVKRGIAKARREGVAIERRTDADALDDFYRLHVRTRRHQGVPTQPKRFIRGLAELFDAGLGYTLLAQLGDRTIAAAVFLQWGGTLTYKYGASEREQLPKRPNNLLFWDAIRRGCEAGLHSLDFGRTDPSNEGLCAFKRAWGAEESDLVYTHLGGEVHDRSEGRLGRVAAGVVRRTPPIVGRAMGEVLYRHVG